MSGRSNRLLSLLGLGPSDLGGLRGSQLAIEFCGPLMSVIGSATRTEGVDIGRCLRLTMIRGLGVSALAREISSSISSCSLLGGGSRSRLTCLGRLLDRALRSGRELGRAMSGCQDMRRKGRFSSFRLF